MINDGRRPETFTPLREDSWKEGIPFAAACAKGKSVQMPKTSRIDDLVHVPRCGIASAGRTDAQTTELFHRLGIHAFRFRIRRGGIVKIDHLKHLFQTTASRMGLASVFLEPGWLIDASGVLGEPALVDSPIGGVFRARYPSAPHLGIVASLRITCVNQPPRFWNFAWH